MITLLNLHVFDVKILNTLLCLMFYRLDETVKALSTGSQVKSPQRFEGPGGRQHMGELVNPNIVQSAPEVSYITNVTQSSETDLLIYLFKTCGTAS